MTGATGTGEVEESIRVQRTRRLWLRVIQQTVQEAQGKSLYGVPHSDYPRHIRIAKRWLTTYSRSLVTACSLAGFNQQQIKLLIEQQRRLHRGNGCRGGS